jgi:hypothetical protein
MPINQIFKKKIPEKLIVKILNTIGIKNMDDNREFYYTNIDNNISETIKCLERLKPYYLPCKKKVYFKNIDSKKIITILRQTLKLYDYIIESREKYIKETKKKCIVYTIHKKITNELVRNINSCTLSFD